MIRHHEFNTKGRTHQDLLESDLQHEAHADNLFK